MNTEATTVVVDGLGCQSIESWYGNLHLTIGGTPVIVGVEYDSNIGYRVDFARFIDSGGSSVYDGMDLTFERDLGWQGIPSPEQRKLLVQVFDLTGDDLERMTAEAGRPNLEVQ